MGSDLSALSRCLFYWAGDGDLKKAKQKRKKQKRLKPWQWEELMGVNDPTYHRVKGGAWKQK